MNIDRMKNDWLAIAKEEINVEYIDGAIYAFGSELAILRLFHNYSYSGDVDSIDSNYSENLKTWFFRLDTK
jgi:hypothetical protein